MVPGYRSKGVMYVVYVSFIRFNIILSAYGRWRKYTWVGNLKVSGLSRLLHSYRIFFKCMPYSVLSSFLVQKSIFYYVEVRGVVPKMEQEWINFSVLNRVLSKNTEGLEFLDVDEKMKRPYHEPKGPIVDVSWTIISPWALLVWRAQSRETIHFILFLSNT